MTDDDFEKGIIFLEKCNGKPLLEYQKYILKLYFDKFMKNKEEKEAKDEDSRD